MIGTASLEQSARKLVKRVMDRNGNHRLGGRTHSRGEANIDLDAGAVAWLLPRLVKLVDELDDQPIQQLEPIIRNMLMEQTFVDDNGDVVMTEDERERIDRRVRLLIRILAHARRRSHTTGRWSRLPLPPQMCG